jgi:2-polyprenyl-3-methyl-5-hydroxy-6-metoxy-1,4-benzoquinol methylase
MQSQQINPHGVGLRSRLFFLKRDAKNVLRYGPSAPKSAMLIFVDPRTITKAVHHTKSARIDSGRIASGKWDKATVDVRTHPKMEGVRQRIIEGAPWQHTALWSLCLGYLKTGGDGLFTVEDIERRYADLDKLIAKAKESREAAFLTRREIRPGNFREAAGIIVHIDRNGELLFGMRGCHRLAIAQALGLTCIPAQLGMVHREAVRKRVWRKRLIDPKRAVMIRSGIHQPGPDAPSPRRYHANTKATSIEFGANQASHWNAEPVEKFARLIPILPGRSVVEIGAAEGILSLTIAPSKDRVRAIDITKARHEQALALKRRWLELGKSVNHCEMVQGDILKNPELIQGFDTLVASRVIYYFGDQLDEFMRNVAANVRHICLIGNPTRAEQFHKGKYGKLGPEFARYATLEGMIDLVERYGFRVTHQDRNLDPLIIADRV